MPKRRKPDGTVDDRDQLDAMFDLEDEPANATLTERINTLESNVALAYAGMFYIQENLQRLRGAFDPLTPTQAANELQAMINRMATRIQALQAYRQQLINFANRQVIPRNGNYAGDGKLYVQFVNIGMGDCTLITTPKGVKILIDCGSDSLSDVTSLIPNYNELVNGSAAQIVGNALKSDLFLNGTSTIEIMILTHPDADHHNMLQTILSTVPNISVNMLYYGGAENIEAFTSSAYIKQIAGTTASNLRMVKLREEEELDGDDDIVVTKSINNKDITDNAGIANQIGKEFINPNTGEIVLYYEDNTDKQSNFKLSILASNATGVWSNGNFVKNDANIKPGNQPKLDATEPNKRSMVVSAECFDVKSLICGDATAVTERFMLDYFGDLLEGVHKLRLGHHGSPTSSSVEFIEKLTAMNQAIASTGGRTTRVHFLPKREVLSLYVGHVPTNAGAHNIWAYDDGDQVAQMYFNGITDKLYATGSNDTVGFFVNPPG